MRVEPPKIVHLDTRSMVATWRSIVMPVMGKEKLPAASAKLQVRALEEHGKKLGAKNMAEITLIANEAPLPEADTRAVLEGGVPIVSPYYGCVSAVFEGTGFRAALVRGILTSFQILSRNKYPEKTFSSIADAAKFTFTHAPTIGMEVASADEIMAAVSQVRDIAVQRGLFSPPAGAAARDAPPA